MILKIAWRNIWRNKVRSTVVILAVAVGLWAGVFASAFLNGMMKQKIKSVVRLELSHIQFHHPAFPEEKLPEDTIPQKNEIIQSINDEPSVAGISARVITMTMMNTPKKSGALKIIGVDPEDEIKVTDIHEEVVEGEYLEKGKSNPILVSRETAEQYKVELHSKMVLTFQDVRGEITAGAFRVTGIYDSGNPMYDKVNAFIRKDNLQQMLGLDGKVHEIAVLLNDTELADPVASKYQEMWPKLEIKSWKDLSPGMRFMVEAMGTYTLIIVGIIMVALLFSIVNTMLMAVLERVHEIGMLMAVGMNKVNVFKMIMLETIFLSLTGGPLGLLLSWLSVLYFGTYGIDLGRAAYGELGFSNLIYPELGFMTYFQVTVMVLVMAVLAAIYPARKALKLDPVEAIQKI